MTESNIWVRARSLQTDAVRGRFPQELFKPSRLGNGQGRDVDDYFDDKDFDNSDGDDDDDDDDDDGDDDDDDDDDNGDNDYENDQDPR